MAFAFVEAPTVPGYRIPERTSPILPAQLYTDLNLVFMKHGANATGHPRLNIGQKITLQFGELDRRVEIERKFAQGQNGTSYEYKLSLECGSKKNHKSDTTDSITRIWYISQGAPIEKFVRIAKEEDGVLVIALRKISIDKPLDEEKNIQTILKTSRPIL